MRRILIPLGLAQFICSFAGSSMNVMITEISTDLHTSVAGVQVVITVFLLVMAALMIPGGALTERWGRKRCLRAGLMIYAAGALLSAIAPGLGVLILGNSLLEGVGTALLIPPVYILATLLTPDSGSRARAFGVITGMGGIGAAAGPLIGGMITEWASWRAVFVFQAVIVAIVIVAGRRITDPLPAQPSRPFDVVGALLSATGLVSVVAGIMVADSSLGAAAGLLIAGTLALTGCAGYLRVRERAGKPVLLPSRVFDNRTANLALVTQNLQWLLLMGVSFVVATYLQVGRGYDAIGTGLIFTAATGGVLCASLAAERLARRHPQRLLIMTGFATTTVGIGLLLLLVRAHPGAVACTPGLLLFGLGVGTMLTPSVNVVQSAFPESDQGEISGLSRAVSNLGSALGTGVAGTLLVAGLADPARAYPLTLLVLAALGIAGFATAALLPGRARPAAGSLTRDV
ncbi:MFS transporter [Nocardia sp. NBC_00511]|uniref:MFS transporter n=1 Tax=Nocardia sp. NBC_00511 TaxID=2903591 RepID=UPI0030E060A2